MGKVIDFFFSESWEEFQRIQLYKKLGNVLENKSEASEAEVNELMNKIK